MSNVVTIGNGARMPLVGFGLWKVPSESAAETVYDAVKAGYRLFDGAYDYANEKEAGKGIKRAIEEGMVKREDIFVTTKLWNNYHRKDHAIAMGKAQNEAWGLGYIDLFLMHFPVALEYVDPEVLRYPGWWMDAEHKTIRTAKVPIQETWQAMEELVDSGTTRAIGFSNAQAQTLYDVMRYARHPISALQIEHHPYLTQPELIDFAKAEGIAVTAYSSFGPQSFYELPSFFKTRAVDTPMLFDHPAVQEVATRLNKSPAQVLLRWATQRGIAVIPKSNNSDRLKQNLEVFDFDLTSMDIESIGSLNKGLRFNDPGYYLDQPLRIFA